MLIDIPDPFLQTLIFAIPLALAILITTRKDSSPHELNIDHTNQLKGIAIMMVLFSHIGYFLDSGKSFLYPLSVAGGVGVNIFLLLSGYGLTISELKHHHNPLMFYLKRLKRVFLPMWIILIFFLLLDYFLLNISYPVRTIFYTAIGFIPDADIYTVFNSPLWYFTLILFYYLIFPLVFWRKMPIFSAALIFIISVLILKYIKLPVVEDVFKLYKLHFIAFPLGVSFAILQTSKYKITNLIKGVNPILRYILVGLLVWSVSYTAIHSGVGEKTTIEQSISLVTMASFIFIILLLPFKSHFLILLGIYSYEIYLIQWPLLYRHDFLYRYLPAGIATILYFVIFIAMSFCIQKGVNLLLTSKSKHS